MAYHLKVAIALLFLCGAMGMPAVHAQSNSVSPQQTQPEPESGLLAYLLFFFLFVALPLFFLLLVRRSGAMKQGQYLQRGEKHMDAAEDHMKIVTDQNARIIKLLETLVELEQPKPK